MKNVAIIPARGGSKTIPHKNIIDFVGRPLIAWSIEQAQQAQQIDEVLVSTDDDKIAEVSKQWGAEVIRRPTIFATDTATSEDAILHALEYLAADGRTGWDYIVFLQATSPLREHEDIDGAVQRLISEQADSLFSCTDVRDFFVWEKSRDRYRSITYDYQNRKRRQDLPPRYLENGSIYVFKPELIKRQRNRLGGRIAIYEMPYWKSLQVDTLEDLEICTYYAKTKFHEVMNGCDG